MQEGWKSTRSRSGRLATFDRALAALHDDVTMLLYAGD
jgi:hypothetical protein